jgi:hypothetical protein
LVQAPAPSQKPIFLSFKPVLQAMFLATSIPEGVGELKSGVELVTSHATQIVPAGCPAQSAEPTPPAPRFCNKSSHRTVSGSAGIAPRVLARVVSEANRWFARAVQCVTPLAARKTVAASSECPVFHITD